MARNRKMNEKYQVTNKVTEVIYSHCEATASLVKATAYGVVSRRRAAPSGYQRESSLYKTQSVLQFSCLAFSCPGARFTKYLTIYHTIIVRLS